MTITDTAQRRLIESNNVLTIMIITIIIIIIIGQDNLLI
jgi:hypothetical protein